jgi:deazaflavin-dependent oxidoreductase (nitroreductase family)
MILPGARSDWFHAAVRAIGASRPGAWFLGRTLQPLDRLVRRLTRGRATLTSVLAGVPVVWLTTTGARSGRPHSVPLLAVSRAGEVVVIASSWGRRRHPAWYHNLRAHPDVTMSYNGRTGRYRAREVHGAEREDCWRLAAALYHGYEAYRERAGTREIPVIVLTPAPAGSVTQPGGR